MSMSDVGALLHVFRPKSGHIRRDVLSGIVLLLLDCLHLPTDRHVQ